MKMPKIRSYIRLVTAFFLSFALLFIIQSAMIHFRFTRTIMPSYLKEKRDITTFIKSEIMREAEKDARFNIREYIREQNRKFPRLKLDFIPGDQVLADETADSQYQYLYFQTPKTKSKLIEAVPISVRGQSGYLILYSTRFRSLNNSWNQLTTFMIFALLPAVIIGFMMFRATYRKSEQLVEAVNRISQGDYSARVSLNGKDEFSFLGQAFNQMAASVDQATAKLKNMDRQRRQFIADISHELSTPLTSIKGYVETLQMEEFKPSPAEERQYLQIIWEETERLSFLVKQLLEIARVDAGTITLEREEINAAEFMAAFHARNMLQLKKLAVHMECPAAPDLLVYADYRRLEQIMQNLLDNALKHSAGISQIVIRMTPEAEGTVRIECADNGAGIRPEHLTRIFDRFYQVPAARNGEAPENPYLSNGLGLSIVKALVELHNGSIAVASEYGKGTTFTIRLPQKKH